jgi:hypothetical protein
VGVLLGARVAVAERVMVGVRVRLGVHVAVGGRVLVALGRAVAVRVEVRVTVGTRVGVSVGVRVGVRVSDGVRVAVGAVAPSTGRGRASPHSIASARTIVVRAPRILHCNEATRVPPARACRRMRFPFAAMC